MTTILCALILTSIVSVTIGQTDGDYQQLLAIVTALQTKVQDLEAENKVIVEKLTIQQAEIEELKSKVNTTPVDPLDQYYETYSDHLHDVLVKELGKKRQVENDVPVAFYGKLDELISDVGVNEIIHFDDIVTDYGHAYDRASGLFTAPAAGLYVFSTTIMIEKQLDTHIGIYINDQLKTRIKLYGREYEYDTMSQTVVYYLRVRDTVSVRHYEGNKTLHGDYTIFTGFLLYQDFRQLSPVNIIG